MSISLLSSVKSLIFEYILSIPLSNEKKGSPPCEEKKQQTKTAWKEREEKAREGGEVVKKENSRAVYVGSKVNATCENIPRKIHLTTKDLWRELL